MSSHLEVHYECYVLSFLSSRMNEYVRGLAEVGANVIGVGDGHVSMLPPKTKHHLSHYLQVPNYLMRKIL